MKRITAPEGCRVVITGAGSGIGEATALRCANEGATDIICADINADSASEIAAACRARGANALGYRCDVADAAAVQTLADMVESERGPVDVLINNAGIGMGGRFLEQSVGDWDWLMGVNLNGVAYGCHAFAGPMAERGRGHIVNIASGAAYLMSRSAAAYCSSKAAVVALSRCLRADLADHGVGVSVLCPGVINTPIFSRSKVYGRTEEELARTQSVFERLGHSPDLVAKAIVKAIRRNQEVVPVGIESRLLYRALPFLPAPVEGALTRKIVL